MGRNKVLYDKRQIIDAAITIVEREGAGELSARRIANELNVSSMTIYNYVDNIDEVKRELMVRCYNNLFSRISERLSRQETQGRDGVTAFIRIYAELFYEYAQEHKNLVKFMLEEGYIKFHGDAELRLFVNPLESFYKQSRDKGYRTSCRIYEDMMHTEFRNQIMGINKLTKEEFLYQIDYCAEKLFGSDSRQQSGDKAERAD